MTPPPVEIDPVVQNKLAIIKWIAAYLIDRHDAYTMMREHPTLQTPIAHAVSYWEGCEDMAASLISVLIGEAMCDVKEIMNIGPDTRYMDVFARLKTVLEQKEKP